MKIGQNFNNSYGQQKTVNKNINQFFLGEKSCIIHQKSESVNDEFIQSPKERYIKELKEINSKNPYITDEKELKELVLQYRADKCSNKENALKIRDRIANSYMDFIVREAGKRLQLRSKYEISQEDLIGEGILAVYDTLDKANIDNLRPAGHIKNRIKKYVQQNIGIIPVSPHIHHAKTVVSNIKTTLMQQLMREPNSGEIEEKLKELGQKNENKKRLLNDSQKPMYSYISTSSKDEDDDNPKFQIPDTLNNPVRMIINTQLTDELVKFVKSIQNKYQRKGDKPDEFRQDLLTHAAGVEITEDESGKPIIVNFCVTDLEEPLTAKYDYIAGKYGAARKAMAENHRNLEKLLPQISGYDKLAEYLDKQSKPQFTPILEALKSGKIDEKTETIVKEFILDSKTLSDRQKFLIAKRYFNGGQTISDIAKESDLNAQTVHSSIRQALNELNKSSVYMQLARELES